MGELQEENEISQFELFIEVDLPPLGIQTYFLSYKPSNYNKKSVRFIKYYGSNFKKSN